MALPTRLREPSGNAWQILQVQGLMILVQVARFTGPSIFREVAGLPAPAFLIQSVRASENGFRLTRPISHILPGVAGETLPFTTSIPGVPSGTFRHTRNQ